MQFPTKYLAAIVLTGLLAAAGVVAQRTQAFNPLFSFNGANGSYPACVLVSDPVGTLYGTALGGTYGYGVVFRLYPLPNGSWVQSVLYNFTGQSDGAYPGAGLVFDTGGTLYGVVFAGGAYNYGGIFQLKPPSTPGGAWTETVLYSFNGRTKGANPHAPLIFGKSGGLYGVAAGGDTGYGVVFQLKPGTSGGPWTLNVLHVFTGGGDGATPAGALLLGKGGGLYGMTAIGGAYNGGTIYQLTAPTQVGGAWTETVLYSFKPGRDGVFPLGGLVAGTNGSLYGTTTAGGNAGAGTVFQLKPPTAPGGAWSESVLYSFRDGADGANPTGTLVFGRDGTLYGTTVYGGGQNSGTVFQMAPSPGGGPWSETQLYSFTGGSDGQNPQYSVAFGKNGALYGTAQYGGDGNSGTIFQLIP
jgi:uncharacterized repeat protein (TIGR03803 family)